MQKKILGLFAACTVLGLWACGDDSGTSSESKESSESNLVVDSYDDLPVCSNKREGSVAYVKDEKIEYTCVDGVWTANYERQSSSSSVVGTEAKDFLNPNISYGEMTDARDKQVYKTVVIGEQTWMAQNLNFVPDTTDEKYAGYKGNSWCYENSADSCAKYGRFYTWAAAMDSAAVFSTNGKGCGYGTTCTVTEPVRGICPEGWHLPSNSDLSTLFTFVGGTSTAGTKLKSTSGWYDSGNGDDSYGFSVLPAGVHYSNGDFSNAGYYASFWNSTEYNSDGAYDWLFLGDFADVYKDFCSKGLAFSVRCLQDSD